MHASSCGTSLVCSSSLLLESIDREPDQHNSKVTMYLIHSKNECKAQWFSGYGILVFELGISVFPQTEMENVKSSFLLKHINEYRGSIRKPNKSNLL